VKDTLPVLEIIDRLGHAALTLKNAGDISAAKHIQFAISLIQRMALADDESIDQPSEND
jgi:hypothetical protein